MARTNNAAKTCPTGRAVLRFIPSYRHRAAHFCMEHRRAMGRWRREQGNIQLRLVSRAGIQHRTSNVEVWASRSSALRIRVHPWFDFLPPLRGLEIFWWVLFPGRCPGLFSVSLAGFQLVRIRAIRVGCFFRSFAPFGGCGLPGSNEWCFFGKKRDGFHILLIYFDFRVVESRIVLIYSAGITAIFHDPRTLNF